MDLDALTGAEVDPQAEVEDRVSVIETVISSLAEEGSPLVSRQGTRTLWKFKYGTIEVLVQLTGGSDEDTLTVWSAVLDLPAKNEEQMMAELMAANWASTLEARFAVTSNQVVVVTSRTVEDLSAAEISRAITLVASIADESDEPLIEKYGQG
ncbi:MAG: YbjN domain-containing protein [Cyanobacteria bacterium P01_H01_bin.130]